MPLPTADTEWPPPRLAPVYGRIATWSAWYSGDTDQLSAVYGGATNTDSLGFFASQGGGFKAAVKRAVDRWFWGTTPPAGEVRTKLHVPLAGDIAGTSADLLFSEPPTFTVKGKKTQERLDELVDDRVHASLLEAADIQAGLGGVYERIVWNRAVADTAWIAPVHPDAAVPDFVAGRLAAVTFWRVLASDGNEVVRHLERHEPGVILHGVYEGDRERLGRAVPLTEFDATAALAEVVTEGNRVETGAKGRLTAAYIPNMRPARCWRGTPSAAYHGRADIQGAEPMLDALDETWSSWMRDLRLGKGRIIAPDVYLQSNGPGRGATFDADREVFSGLSMLPAADGSTQLTIAQFAIRVEEHDRTATALTENIIRHAGYSAQSFGVTGDVAMTATEVSARERRSFITRDKKVRYWRPELSELMETLLIVDREVFRTGVEPERPEVEFGDSVQEDPTTVATTAELLSRARAASRDTLVRMVHPDWDDEQVEAEVKAIEAEDTAAVPTADTFGEGMASDNPGNNIPGNVTPAADQGE